MISSYHDGPGLASTRKIRPTATQAGAVVAYHSKMWYSIDTTIPYLLDVANRRIIIDDIAQHDAAYDRINKL